MTQDGPVPDLDSQPSCLRRLHRLAATQWSPAPQHAHMYAAPSLLFTHHILEGAVLCIYVFSYETYGTHWRWLALGADEYHQQTDGIHGALQLRVFGG